MGHPPHHVVFGRDVYVAPTAYIAGDVVIGDECTIMHHVVIRGDVAPIRIGRRVNIQDGAVLHCNRDVTLEIADEVAIGHRAVVHGKRIGPRSLIGIGALVLDGVEIGAGCIVAPGAVVPPGTVVPDGKVLMGVPAQVVRDANDRDRAYHARVIDGYKMLRRLHAAGEYPPARPE